MIFFTSFIKFGVADLYGVEYNQDGTILLETPDRLTDYEIPSKCQIINGGNSPLQSSFLQCKNGIKTLTFAKNSELTTIFPFVFKESTLESIDMSSCTKLKKIDKSVFYGCFRLTKVILPEGITSIEAGAFAECTSLVSIRIPDSVQYIKGWVDGHKAAFTGCVLLEEANISENSELLKIDWDAFSHTSLRYLYIPRNTSLVSKGIFGTKITKIDVHPDNDFFVFENDALLSKDKTELFFLTYVEGRTYTVPSYVTMIGSCALRSNPLSNIILHENISFIDGFAFGYSSLTNFKFPSKVTRVCGNLFEEARLLETVEMTPSITRIDGKAFFNCVKLRTIIMSDNINETASNIFYGCVSLERFDCPSKLVKIGVGNFAGCTKVVFNIGQNTALKLENNILYMDNSALECFQNSGEVVIPATCTKLSDYIFMNRGITKVTINSNTELTISMYSFASTKISEIVLPDCLTSISEFAFSQCMSLTTVSISKNSQLSSFGSGCFEDCPLLSTISFTKNLQTIGDAAFNMCPKLESVNLVNTKLTKIGARAFKESPILTITIPATVQSIGEQCFYQSKIETLSFGSNGIITIIPEEAFYGCTNLNSITFSDSIREINSFAFKLCTNLTEITFPLNLEEIKARAFEKCISLTNFRLKKGCKLQNIGGLAFNGCDNLYDIFVDRNDSMLYSEEGVLLRDQKSILMLFLSASKKTIFVVPSTIKEIKNYAFCNCKNLRTVTIPEGAITTVGYSSFEGCTSLSSLYLPKTLVNFGRYAFRNCVSLQCGSVIYRSDDYSKAINAGIPEIAFEMDCPTKMCRTCNERRIRGIHILFFAINLLLIY